MDTLSVPFLLVCPHRYFRVGYCQFPHTSICGLAITNKNSLRHCQSHALFLEHSSSHSGSIPVYTDGSKSDVGVGYGVVFSSFHKGASLPGGASVFTAELSAVISALRIIFTLPVSSLTIFSDFHSAFSTLEFFTPSSHPLVVSILELFLPSATQGMPTFVLLGTDPCRSCRK